MDEPCTNTWVYYDSNYPLPIFFLIFSPIGLLFRLIKKDLNDPNCSHAFVFGKHHCCGSGELAAHLNYNKSLSI